MYRVAVLLGISPVCESQWRHFSQHSGTTQGISYDIHQQLSGLDGVGGTPPSSVPSVLEECAMHGRLSENLAKWLQPHMAMHACGFPTIEQRDPSDGMSHR